MEEFVKFGLAFFINAVTVMASECPLMRDYCWKAMRSDLEYIVTMAVINGFVKR